MSKFSGEDKRNAEYLSRVLKSIKEKKGAYKQLNNLENIDFEKIRQTFQTAKNWKESEQDYDQMLYTLKEINYREDSKGEWVKYERIRRQKDKLQAINSIEKCRSQLISHLFKENTEEESDMKKPKILQEGKKGRILKETQNKIDSNRLEF